jgi:hypothetical protein
MSTMTEKQAYAAMFRFLEQLYLRTKSDELGGLLGGMSMLEDGFPADPAIVNDWRQAVEYALEGERPASLELRDRRKET